MLAKTARVYSGPRQTYAGLTAKQSRQAKSFLASILVGSVMAKNAGVQMDITKCVQAYRGYAGRKTV